MLAGCRQQGASALMCFQRASLVGTCRQSHPSCALQGAAQPATGLAAGAQAAPGAPARQTCCACAAARLCCDPRAPPLLLCWTWTGVSCLQAVSVAQHAAAPWACCCLCTRPCLCCWAVPRDPCPCSAACRCAPHACCLLRPCLDGGPCPHRASCACLCLCGCAALLCRAEPGSGCSSWMPRMQKGSKQHTPGRAAPCLSAGRPLRRLLSSVAAAARLGWQILPVLPAAQVRAGQACPASIS